MTVLSIVAPVFALIAIGFVAVRTRFVSEVSQKGLSEFAFSLATPALLFKTVATGQALTVSPVRLWLVYFGALAIVWITSMVLTRFALCRPMADAASIAMTSTSGPTGASMAPATQATAKIAQNPVMKCSST